MSVFIPIIILLALFSLGIPVAFCIFFSTLSYFLMSDLPMIMLVQRLAGGLESVTLLAIPFFIMAGVFMNHSGISERLLKFCEVLTGHLNGGLAQVNVALSTLMGGLSGSNIADAAMNSKLLVPQMVARGYSASFSSAVTAAGSLITPIIPPGIAMIIYGYVNNVSIGRLFLAGVVPGFLLCVLMMILVSVISKKRGYLPIREKRASCKEIIFSAKDAVLALMLPIIIIGGIRMGVFTPTEAGAIAVIYALGLGMFVYRKMDFRQLWLATRESALGAANVLLIICVAVGFSKFLTWERVPQSLASWITQIVDSPLAFLMIVNVTLLILGMFLEGNAIMIVLAPLLAPIAHSYGVDPIHFGIVFIFNGAIGTITPPLGTVMFTTCSITEVPIEKFIKDVLPFWALLVVELLLLTYIPAITTTLPNLVYGA
ncbi:TRAP transporter large permease [Testudinibacter aquarius]|uniref:TRAP transporter large permease protein n=1 Tax=Testudinibacter aquarius TaxID=1524974 RepID=A0A4R3YAJ5_9PAST|nr:TRAP transporter large permease [Testudinibacter aquarius]KAE9529823.1 C4-dicarboxylate ABC transporter [Testudinibacter aquarius]TCV89415.1 tripartite ATP-independent transporter DctM subunit [Testudinibacter aquarius]TNG90081.1 TRAP transporter large permease [Testudinibacter aquarius]